MRGRWGFVGILTIAFSPIEEKLAVSLRPGDRRCADVDRHDPAITEQVDRGAQHAGAHSWIANHAALANLFGRRLELRLDEGTEDALGREELHDGIDDMGDARKRDIADRKVERCAVSHSRHIDDIRSLEQGDTLVVSKRPCELGAPDIDRNDTRGPSLQQAVGKPAGGAADIEAGKARRIDPKGVECALELKTAATDIGTMALNMKIKPGQDLLARRREPPGA